MAYARHTPKWSTSKELGKKYSAELAGKLCAEKDPYMFVSTQKYVVMFWPCWDTEFQSPTWFLGATWRDKATSGVPRTA